MSIPEVKKILEEYEERESKIKSILFKITDPELKLIKGHLLIEELLFELVNLKMKKTSSIVNSKLTFSQLIMFFEGLYYEEELNIEWLCSSIKQLNKIRNKLAHNLSTDNFQVEINKFTTFVFQNNKTNNNPIDKLMLALFIILSKLVYILSLSKKINLLPNSAKSLSFSCQILMTKMLNN